MPGPTGTYAFGHLRNNCGLVKCISEPPILTCQTIVWLLEVVKCMLRDTEISLIKDSAITYMIICTSPLCVIHTASDHSYAGELGTRLPFTHLPRNRKYCKKLTEMDKLPTHPLI